MWGDVLRVTTSLFEITGAPILRRIEQAARSDGRQMIGTLAFVYGDDWGLPDEVAHAMLAAKTGA